MKKEAKLDSDVFNKIHETVGTASMCWENVNGAGVFRSDEAAEVSKELCDFIHRRMIKRPITFAQHAKFFITSVIKGVGTYSLMYGLYSTLLYIGLGLWLTGVTWTEAFGIFITLRMVKVAIIKLPTDLHHKKNDIKSKKY